MKSRLEDIIKDLDNCIQEDIKVSSQIFGLAAASIQKNQELLEQLQKKTEPPSQDHPSLPPTETHPLTKESLQKQYGSYQAAYQYYHENYGISCQRGWKHLLKAIQELSSPQKTPDLGERVNVLENRVQELEETIKLLVECIKNLNQ